jgi:hypothetical protein
MIVYTGWVAVTFGGGGDLQRDLAIAFVPDRIDANGDVEIQAFKPSSPDLGRVEAAVTVSLSSFGGDPDTAAVDEAAVSLTRQTHLTGDPLVLVLNAALAAADGSIHGLAYQVTVLVHPDLLDGTVTVDRSETPVV